MSVDPVDLAFDRPVPIFPLPNAVLFPGATLPLHIFEERYREMTRDVLGGGGLIAMALLCEGYVELYHTNHAEIHPVVCVGRVRECVETVDGRFLLNLEGLCRARVLSEDREGPYRMALLEPVDETPAGVIEPDGAYGVRRALEEVLGSTPFDMLEDAADVRSLNRPDVPIGRVVDALASKLVPAEEVEIKQRMLEESDAVRRGTILVEELRTVREMLRVRQSRQSSWPRDEGTN
jgi:Lon protease-like protein